MLRVRVCVCVAGVDVTVTSNRVAAAAPAAAAYTVSTKHNTPYRTRRRTPSTLSILFRQPNKKPHTSQARYDVVAKARASSSYTEYVVSIAHCVCDCADVCRTVCTGCPLAKYIVDLLVRGILYKLSNVCVCCMLLCVHACMSLSQMPGPASPTLPASVPRFSAPHINSCMSGRARTRERTVRMTRRLRA